MVVHDEESLEEALLLAKQGSVRYSDQYAYVIITDSKTLEHSIRKAFERGDIAIVVPLGQEKLMEGHSAEKVKVLKRRKREEAKGVREFFSEHPERVEKIRKYAEKRGQLEKGEEE